MAFLYSRPPTRISLPNDLAKQAGSIAVRSRIAEVIACPISNINHRTLTAEKPALALPGIVGRRSQQLRTSLLLLATGNGIGHRQERHWLSFRASALRPLTDPQAAHGTITASPMPRRKQGSFER